jgi:hypothetical protein
MQTNFKPTTFVSFLIICMWIFHSCTKEKNTNNNDNNDNMVESTDKMLYDMSKSSNGFIWYKKTDALLATSLGSAHPGSFLRTRYNSVAATKLDNAGKIMLGVSFPEGSLIVKELYENSTKLIRYAILYKKSNSPDADEKGWVWGYINPDGGIALAASAKGSGCKGCHSQADNIDYMLMNKYFP